MRLEIFTQKDSKFWNEIVDHSLNGTLFHRWEWLKIVEKHSGCQLFPLVFYDNDKDRYPFGAIPLFLMKKLRLKMVFSPPPACSINLGHILVDKNYKPLKLELSYLDFQAKIDDFIKGLGANYTLFITSPGISDMRPFLWAKYDVSPCYTYKIDLRPGEQAVLASISRTLRQDINSSLGKGVRIIESDLRDEQDIDYLHESLNDRYSRQNIRLPLSKAYLQDIIHAFGHDHVKLFMAIFEDKPVGATLFTYYKDTVAAWVGAVRYKSNELEVNGCIYREIIARAIKDKLTWFEIMGANTRHLCASKAKYSPLLDLQFQIKKTDLWGKLAEKAYTLRKYSR